MRNVGFLNLLGINGMVLYPFVLYADQEPSLRVRRHEQVHLSQIRKVGVLRFYRRYLMEYLILRFQGNSHDKAYRGISFEVEAYALENDESIIIS